MTLWIWFGFSAVVTVFGAYDALSHMEGDFPLPGPRGVSIAFCGGVSALLTFGVIVGSYL